MSQKALMGLIIALCILAIMVDFTSKIMSITSDGLILSGVIYLVWRLQKMDKK